MDLIFVVFVDKDECADPTLNDCLQKCENTVGGYLCQCWAGYKEKNGHCRLTYTPDLGQASGFWERELSIFEYNFKSLTK